MKTLITLLALLCLGMECYGWNWKKIFDTTTRFRKQLTMKYGPAEFQKFKYGKPAEIGDYPAVAKVRRWHNRTWEFCGGVILTLDKVLTAYNCLFKLRGFKVSMREGEVSVVAGSTFSYDNYGYSYDPETESFTSEESQMRMMDYWLSPSDNRVTYHSKKWENFKLWTYRKDLLIIVLKSPFFYNRNLASAVLYSKDPKVINKTLEPLAKESAGPFCKIVSFGYDTYEPVQMVVRIKLVKELRCQIDLNMIGPMYSKYRNALSYFPFYSEGLICGYYVKTDKEPELDIHKHDRFGIPGDPMFCHGDYLFGITSFQIMIHPDSVDEWFGRIFFPFVVTRMDDILPFLEESYVYSTKSQAILYYYSLPLILCSSAFSFFGHH